MTSPGLDPDPKIFILSGPVPLPGPGLVPSPGPVSDPIPGPVPDPILGPYLALIQTRFRLSFKPTCDNKKVEQKFIIYSVFNDHKK